jgi:hypothetical protein
MTLDTESLRLPWFLAVNPTIQHGDRKAKEQQMSKILEASMLEPRAVWLISLHN